MTVGCKLRCGQRIVQINLRCIPAAFRRVRRSVSGALFHIATFSFTFEGANKDISVLKRADKKLKDAIGKALKPSESGFLIRNVVYFDVDVSLEDVASPSSNEERLNCDIQTAKNVLNDLVQIGERV